MKRWFSIVGLTSMAVLCVAMSAWAFPTVDGSADESHIDLDGTDERPGLDAPAEGATDSAPQLAYRHVPTCAGNNPNIGVNEMCVEAGDACDGPAVAHWRFVAPAGTPLGEPGWTQEVGIHCLEPGEAAEPLPVMSLVDFQRLPLPAGTSTVQPPSPHVLINMPTIVYATEASPIVLETELLSYPVQVRATPQRYSWDFGDGFVLGPTRDAGAPWPALRNHHAYTERGTFEITMTTHYTGEYSVAGGPWLPISGEAEVQSAPVTKQVIAGKNELVAEPIP